MFGANVGYATLIKTYQEKAESDKRHSPGQFDNALPILVSENPKTGHDLHVAY